ncbi:malto-oligosyltrehalose synthase [Acetobacteraceae bacterium H6797]|nr:malto-oligosyltrehalose synthase [Acetobacteraceae bacterium H6797]
MPGSWRATYRLQFHAGFTFDDAAAIAPYLANLGISHVYASPIFTARPGSTHGYDVTDPTSFNPELGGEEGFRRLSAALKREGLGLLIDIVPNHMATHADNACWMAALSAGRRGPAADIFDIDWDAHPKVLLPVLGDTLANSLAQGALKLDLDAERGWITISAYDGAHAWPIRPEDTARLLGLAGLAQAERVWSHPTPADFSAARLALRDLDATQQEGLRAVLAREDVAALLEQQHWRPAHWRSGGEALSWRRFFNITELVGVRVEQPEVFALVHHLPLSLLREELIDGLRIDHIDGLADPAGYCRRLRVAAGPEALIVVEKILGHGEEIRSDWPINGTSGYERLNAINGLFVAPKGYAALSQHLRERGWVPGEPGERLRAAKRQMLAESFEPELAQLTAITQQALATEKGQEFGPASIRRALAALIAHCPVYRSYIRTLPVNAADEALWAGMTEAAVADLDPWAGEAARAISRHILTGDEPAHAALRRRFQQLSGPMMAKGLEDTEFYRAVALTSVNEVGGEIEAAGRGIAEFHALCEARGKAGACDITPLATHDTKRGPETRARLNLLSLDPGGWIAQYSRWSAMNAPLRRDGAPDAADEWLIYQTILGAWPIDAERLRTYLTKAMREAKRHTRWEDQKADYEEPTLAFATALLEAPEAAGFREEIALQHSRMALPTRLNALAQTILQLTMPGVPDIYQGTEWWDFSLVDPDNRRPVDYAARRAALEAALPPLAEDEHGAVKQHVTQALLTLRHERPALFTGYEPLTVPEGEGGWLGFMRGEGRLLVMVPTRVTAAEAPPLPALSGRWRDVLREAGCEGLPFAVLLREE